ncbi:MAG: hypothetical protein HC920_00880 [Oscillatoriales cyanobacterium SM2_3_0]|nr:hypothetical protein [Oscillatoriales cyanobacterium SM2_3_0]
MFDQFRSLYPTGSLISEFVTVAEGQFVVRALVEVEGVTLSTGLAAAKTVELAEDQAKRRSLQALGIEIPAALPQMPRVTTAESSSSPLQTPGAATPNLEAQLHSLTDPDPEEEDWLSENTLDSAPSKNRAQNLSLSLPELRLEEGEGEIPP